MAEYQTTRLPPIGDRIRPGSTRGLRAHMNRVYATMSGGMLITAAAAWAIANLAVTFRPHRAPPWRCARAST